MIVRDDLPPTPDWLPDARDQATVSTHVDPPAYEAMPLRFEGDDS